MRLQFWTGLQPRELPGRRRADDVGISAHEVGNARCVFGHDLHHQAIPVGQTLLPVVRILLEADVIVWLPLFEDAWAGAQPDWIEAETIVADQFARSLRPDAHEFGQEGRPRRVRHLEDDAQLCRTVDFDMRQAIEQ